MHVLAITVGGWEITAQYVFRGFIEGLTYGMVALGLVLIYKASGVINFAQGQFGAFGALLMTLLSHNYGIPLGHRPADRDSLRCRARWLDRAVGRAPVVHSTSPVVVRGHVGRQPAHHLPRVPVARAREPRRGSCRIPSSFASTSRGASDPSTSAAISSRC